VASDSGQNPPGRPRTAPTGARIADEARPATPEGICSVREWWERVFVWSASHPPRGNDMPPFHAVYYRAPDGTEPVRDFLLSLDKKRRVSLRNQIARLNLLSDEIPHLPFPHSSQVEGELRELRCHYGAEHYRVLYRRSESLLVLLHAFRKTTKQLPTSDIATATTRRQDFQARMNAKPRRRPRAAGHDAP